MFHFLFFFLNIGAPFVIYDNKKVTFKGILISKSKNEEQKCEQQQVTAFTNILNFKTWIKEMLGKYED